MQQLDIKKRIDENNKLIESLMTPNVFTLNNTVAEILAENAQLQNECEHVFEEGFCIYCYKNEEVKQ
jgi:hypothetical protein